LKSAIFAVVMMLRLNKNMMENVSSLIAVFTIAMYNRGRVAVAVMVILDKFVCFYFNFIDPLLMKHE